MDFYTRKIAYIWLRMVEVYANSVVWVYAIMFSRRKKHTGGIKSIGAYWNLPPDLTGSNLRLGAWKDFFEKDGFVYDNFHINNFADIVKYSEKGTWTQRYNYFAKTILRRIPQILKAHKYDCIWIDRGMIPFYPRKSAFIEKQLRKVVAKLVVDTTDGGDYQGNPVLMEDTLRQADEITVGYKYLKEFYEDRFKVTQVFWTIPTDVYIEKTSYELSNPPVIGWMGSPGNFSYVRELIPELQKLSQTHDFVFRYICRDNFDAEFAGVKTEHHFYNDDYYKLISSFDIGISPFLKKDLKSKGKIAMKHQEYMLMGIPQVCSSVAISEFVEHEKHVMIAEEIKDWVKSLTALLENSELRESIAKNSKALFYEYYTYESQYSKLKKVLTELN